MSEQINSTAAYKEIKANEWRLMAVLFFIEERHRLSY